MGTRIYVGNISYSATEQEIRDFFGVSVREVKIVTDKDTGRPRGFVFVDFNSESDTKVALGRDGEEMMGRSLRIQEATPRRTKPKG